MSNTKIITIFILNLILTFNSVYASSVELPVSHDLRVTRTRQFYWGELTRAEEIRDVIQKIARREQTSANNKATSKRDKAYKEIEANQAQLTKLFSTKQNWNTRKRVELLSKLYSASAELERGARTAWRVKNYNWLTPADDTEKIANHMHIQYRWFTSVIRTYYDKVKSHENLEMSLGDAISLAETDLKAMTQFKKQAKASMDWIVSNAEGWTWEARCKVVLDIAEEAFDYYTMDLAYLKGVVKKSAPDKLIAAAKVKKDEADRIMNESMSIAATRFMADTQKVRDDVLKIYFKANVIVEDKLDAPWVLDQLSFNYTLECSLEETLAIAVVIKGYKHNTRLELNEEGYYKEPNSIETAYPQMLDSCMAITVPKSGTNTKIGEIDRTLGVYRHWWRTDGKEETEEEKIALPIIRLMKGDVKPSIGGIEGKEIRAVIKQLRILKEFFNKPVYLTYGTDTTHIDFDNDKQSITKIIDRLTKLNELDLISGTLHINSVTAEFVANDLDGNLVYGSDKIKEAAIINSIKEMLINHKLN